MLGKLFGSNRDIVTGGWRKLCDGQLNNLYSSPFIIRIIKSRRIGYAWHVALMGEKLNAYRILVGRPEGKRLIRRSGRMWEDNVKWILET